MIHHVARVGVGGCAVFTSELTAVRVEGVAEVGHC